MPKKDIDGTNPADAEKEDVSTPKKYVPARSGIDSETPENSKNGNSEDKDIEKIIGTATLPKDIKEENPVDEQESENDRTDDNDVNPHTGVPLGSVLGILSGAIAVVFRRRKK